ncbi:MAG: hypothetical protein AAF518_09795 [Spirochaetota bacterium]
MLNQDGSWRAAELKQISSYLLYEDFQEKHLDEFFSKTIEANNQNQYLQNFFLEAKNRTWSGLKKTIAQEGKYYLPEVISYALVLERLTISMRQDWQILLCCQEVWKKARVEEKLDDYLNFFEITKIYSMDMVADVIYGTN